MSEFQKINWQIIDNLTIELPSSYREWIVHSGSFMERLKQHGIRDARVQVLREKWEIPSQDEREKLDLVPNSDCLVREVLIKNDTAIWMFARTVFPHSLLKGKLKELAHLKDRSLGSILFKDPAMQRSQFEIISLTPTMELYDKATTQVSVESNLWARRSIFYLQKKSLLLTEVFLPDMDQIPKDEVKN